VSYSYTLNLLDKKERETLKQRGRLRSRRMENTKQRQQVIRRIENKNKDNKLLDG